MGGAQLAERGYFDRDPNEKISLTSIKRRIEKFQIGILVLDKDEWEFILEKILPKVGATVLIKYLPTRIEDVLRIRRGEGGITTELQFAYIFGKFRTVSIKLDAGVQRISM